MKINDIIKVYEDPVTKQKLEETAKVVQILESEKYNDGILYNAKVEFENEPGITYDRQVFE